MTKRLKEMRETMALELKSYCHCPGPTCFGCEHMSSKLFRKGFNAAVKELWPEIEKSVKALNFVKGRQKHTCNIEYGNNTGIENCALCRALDSLNAFKEKWGVG